MSCKGNCGKYRIKTREYNLELCYRRCTVCGVFIQYVGLHCPCCDFRLRLSARSNKQSRKQEKKTTVLFLEQVKQLQAEKPLITIKVTNRKRKG